MNWKFSVAPKRGSAQWDMHQTKGLPPLKGGKAFDFVMTELLTKLKSPHLAGLEVIDSKLEPPARIELATC